MRTDLVLEGGGVKGIGLVGAVSRLGRDHTFERVAGTSVGAVVGSLVAAGFGGADLESELFEFPFDEVMHPDLLDRLPLLGPLASIGFERGVWETSRVRDHLAEVLAKRGISTFADLRLDDERSSLAPGRRYRLVVTTTDVTTGELLYLPWDYADRLGLDPDEQLVADAVAASIAIPFFFEPVTLVDPRDDTEHVLVDGGLLSNFPIGVFDRTDHLPPRWPTFGLKIMPRLPEGAQELVPFAGRIPLPGIRHLEAVLATVLVGRDQTFLSRPDVRARTIEIDTGGAGVVEFGLSDTQKRRLRDHGWEAADRFLGGWDWDGYRRRHRPTSTPVDAEPTVLLTLLVEVDADDGSTRERLQVLVDDVLVEDARGEGWTVRRFFDDDAPGSVEGHYEVLGHVPVSPAYPVQALGFELATALTEAMSGDLTGRAMPDLPSTAFGREAESDDAVDGLATGATADAAGPSWPLEVMRCPEAWQLEPAPGGAPRGRGIVVGHPDTGFTWHRELIDSLDLTRDHDIVDRDRVAEDPLTRRWWWPLDSPGHGTSTGSVIISGEADLVTGTAPEATLIPMRAVRSVVQVSDGDVARAIDRSRAAGAHVISMSLGGVGFYSGIRAAIRKARDEGIIVLAAAGNQVRIVVAPARFEECIAVAGTDHENRPWSGSSRGDPVLISAPGHGVPMAKAEQGSTPSAPGSAVSTSSGTSYAVAHLAGVAALWLAHHGRDALLARYGPQGVQEAFETTLTTTGFTRPDDWDDGWGVGVVDAMKVLTAALPEPAPPAPEATDVAVTPGPLERLTELGVTFPTDARTGLCSLLGCDDSEVDELARRHGAELAYLYAEGELPTLTPSPTTDAGAPAAPTSAVMSPRLRSRLAGA